jgi:hypothetical protein
MDGSSNPQNNFTPVRFYFYNMKFSPYVGVSKSSSDIIHDVMRFLSVEHRQGKGILIDRNENRQGSQRPLFVTNATFMLKEKRIRGTLALLRSGKVPMLKPADKFELIPLDKSAGQIAEVTHFFIDYSQQSPVLCLEFNSEGPRVTDLEYYIRIVARDKLRIARGTELELFMDVPIDKALSEFKNVLNFELKVQPSKLAQLNTELTGQYLTGLTTLDQRINPKFIKIEALFQTQGKVKSNQINAGANKMFKAFLEAFKTKKQNIDVFDNFVVKYVDMEGREEIFSLLKGKRELEKMIDLETIKERTMYELIEKDFDDFMQSQF